MSLSQVDTSLRSSAERWHSMAQRLHGAASKWVMEQPTRLA